MVWPLNVPDGKCVQAMRWPEWWVRWKLECKMKEPSLGRKQRWNNYMGVLFTQAVSLSLEHYFYKWLACLNIFWFWTYPFPLQIINWSAGPVHNFQCNSIKNNSWGFKKEKEIEVTNNFLSFYDFMSRWSFKYS